MTQVTHYLTAVKICRLENFRANVLNAADSGINHAVHGKTIAFTVSAAVHFGVCALFLDYQCIEIISSSKIQRNVFFRAVQSKPQRIKSLRQK